MTSKTRVPLAYAACAALFLYGAAQTYWSLGGAGFPFGADDANPEYSAFEHVGRDRLAPWLAAGFLSASVVAALLAPTGRGLSRVAARALYGATALYATAVVCTLTDFRLLGNLAYALMFRFGAINWSVLNQLFAVVGVALLVGAAVAHHRRRTDACGRCGRRSGGAGWATPEAAARWGRRAAYTAIVVPLFYAATRWAWLFGWPLGISDELWEEGQEDNLWFYGGLLATMGALGSLLTLGLVQRWGETFPRWMVGLRGRRVPVTLATIPASVVAVLTTIAGVMYIRLHLTGAFDNPRGDWGASVPETIWPVWGVALGLATLAYYLRRRGACRRCGRG
ncbi:hypothetical protein [Streptomyces avicenniae]|uniref:hypothetical protein n=1 Tax=Streptomyces avicenniae TaxID=500153 RepID=UPI00167E626C|nr:hypothetical protein [Streptomyces avicenniae]